MCVRIVIVYITNYYFKVRKSNVAAPRVSYTCTVCFIRFLFTTIKPLPSCFLLSLNDDDDYDAFSTCQPSVDGRQCSFSDTCVTLERFSIKPSLHHFFRIHLSLIFLRDLSTTALHLPIRRGTPIYTLANLVLSPFLRVATRAFFATTSSYRQIIRNKKYINN